MDTKEKERKNSEEKLKYFKHMCTFYSGYKKQIIELEKKYPELKSMKFNKDHIQISLNNEFGRGDLELYQLLKQYMNPLDHVLSKIEELFGTEAENIVIEACTHGNSQESIAQKYGMTRRQLQYKLDQWLKEAMKDD